LQRIDARSLAGDENASVGVQIPHIDRPPLVGSEVTGRWAEYSLFHEMGGARKSIDSGQMQYLKIHP
jgi:hypothetical protein